MLEVFPIPPLDRVGFIGRPTASVEPGDVTNVSQ